MEAEANYYIFYEQPNSHINTKTFLHKAFSTNLYGYCAGVYSGLKSRIVPSIVFL